MRRRTYLARLASGGSALTAGCVGARVSRAASDEPTASATPGRRLADVDPPVPESALVPAIHSVIPAIVEPAFARDWAGVEIEAGGETVEPRLAPRGRTRSASSNATRWSTTACRHRPGPTPTASPCS